MKKSRMSNRTVALLVAALMLLGAGAVTGVRAAPNVQSELYRTHFYLNHLQIHLIENGEDVCGEVNTLDGSNKVTGPLATTLGYKDDDNLGSVEPGRIYDEEIAARNSSDISEFVRITIRKYWVNTDEDGKVIKDSSNKPIKNTELKPSLIHLMYNGKDRCNTSAWTENTQERTTESRTYYCKKLLKGGNDSAPIFNQVMIDGSLAKLSRIEESEENGKKIFTSIYKYDGCAFFIEADVQAIQTHNAQDAIHSQWGVYNVTATYNDEGSGNESGSLTVN